MKHLKVEETDVGNISLCGNVLVVKMVCVGERGMCEIFIAYKKNVHNDRERKNK